MPKELYSTSLSINNESMVGAHTVSPEWEIQDPKGAVRICFEAYFRSGQIDALEAVVSLRKIYPGLFEEVYEDISQRLLNRLLKKMRPRHSHPRK